MKTTPNEKLECARLFADSLGISVNQLLKKASKAHIYRWAQDKIPESELDEARECRAFFSALEQDPTYSEYIKAVEQLSANRHHRTARLRSSIEGMVDTGGQLVFGTLTFTNECLNSTSEDTRRTYVRRFLKQYFAEYRANIDYGDQTGREHYHCVALMSNKSDILPDWPYGFWKWEPFRNVPSSPQKVARYINKLANHATKVAPRIIYSRKGKNLPSLPPGSDPSDVLPSFF